MEGISIGRQETEWYLGLNYEVRSWGCVTGWHYLAEPPYKLDLDMSLLDEEIQLSGKCLIKW